MPPGDAASAAGRDRTAVVPVVRWHCCRTARRGRLAVGRASSCTRQRLVVKILKVYIFVHSVLKSTLRGAVAIPLDHPCEAQGSMTSVNRIPVCQYCRVLLYSYAWEE